MGFVVEDHDPLHAHQVGHDTLDHLAFGFEGPDLFTVTLQQTAIPRRKIHRFTELECVVVGDDDLGLFKITQHLSGYQFPALVIAVGVIREQDAESVPDGDAGCDDQEPAGVFLAAWAACCVDRLPGDEHRHDGGLARARGKLQCKSVESRVRALIGILQQIENRPAFLAHLGGNFGQPDGHLDSFNLTEERAQACKLVITPMLKESRRLWRHLPAVGVL